MMDIDHGIAPRNRVRNQQAFSTAPTRTGWARETRQKSQRPQLHINILFDLTLVIDAAIKHKNAGQWKFIRHAEHLSTIAGHQLRVQPELRDINAQFEQDFNATVTRAIEGTLTTGGVALDRLQCDIALAYGIRNFGAHSTGTAPIIWQRFADVHRSLQRVLLTTIEYLY